jgi:hypothetical protein
MRLARFSPRFLSSRRLWRPVAIGEARNIRQSLRNFGLGQSDAGHAIPLIARSLFELRCRRLTIYRWIAFPFEIVILGLFLGVYYLELAAFPELQARSPHDFLSIWSGDISQIYYTVSLFFVILIAMRA